MKHWKILFLGLLIFHLLLLVKTQFTAWPEMLFWPYLILKGWLPYRDIGIAHSPLLVVELSVFYKFTGIGIWQQKTISWILPILIDVILFIIVKTLFGKKSGLITLFFFVLFQVYYDGNGIWFDHALALYSVLIFFLITKKRYYLVGIFWTLAFLTKQTAFWFALPIAVSFLFAYEKKRFFTRSIMGFLSIAIVFLISLFVFGIEKDYFQWSIVFGVGTLPRLAGNISSYRLLVSSLVPYAVFLPLLLHKKSRQKTTPILLWSVAGAMGAVPRFELFHFQPALPFLSYAYCLLIEFILVTKKVATFYLIIPLATLILLGRGLVRKLNQPDRFYETSDQKIVKVLRNLVSSGQPIFVTNYWDNIYPLTNTIPAFRPFIPQLTQYITPGVDSEISRELAITFPVTVVRGQFTTPASQVFRFEKINHFIDNNYKVQNTIGGVDILVRNK